MFYFRIYFSFIFFMNQVSAIGEVLLFNDSQECIDFLHDKMEVEMNEQEWEVNEGIYFIELK